MKNAIPALDGLRAFACLLVVFGHFAKEEIILDIKGSGQLGVMLFFVLSGFLMAWLYGGQPLSPLRLADYALRRVFRVVPAYLAVLGMSLLLTPYWAEFPYAMDWSGFMKHLTLQGDTSVFWTIPVELKFYVCFPLFWWALSFAPTAAWRAGLMVPVYLYAVQTFPCANCDRLSLARYVEFFIAGVFAGYLHPVLSPWLQRYPRGVQALLACLLVLIIVFIPQVFLHLTQQVLGHGIIHPMWQMPQVLATLFALVVLACANAGGLFAAIFSSRVMTWLGDISFSLYLLHYPVIVFLECWTRTALPAVFQVIVALALAVLLASVSCRLIEQPFRTLARRLGERLRKRGTVS